MRHIRRDRRGRPPAAGAPGPGAESVGAKPPFRAAFALGSNPQPICRLGARPGAMGFLPGQEEGSRDVDAFLNSLNDIIWSMALVGLCLGLGLYFSIRTRFMQVWGVPEM